MRFDVRFVLQNTFQYSIKTANQLFIDFTSLLSVPPNFNLQQYKIQVTYYYHHFKYLLMVRNAFVHIQIPNLCFTRFLVYVSSSIYCTISCKTKKRAGKETVTVVNFIVFLILNRQWFSSCMKYMTKWFFLLVASLLTSSSYSHSPLRVCQC